MLAPSLILAASWAEAAPSISLVVERYPIDPILDFLDGSSAWEFSYNPAFLPGHKASPAVPDGLFVRVQNGSAAPAGSCGPPASASFVAFAAFSDGIHVQRLSNRVLFKPEMTPWEQTAEDPRVVYDAAHGRWIMTYTANGLVTEGSKPPMNRHQGIATSRDPLSGSKNAWVRHCSAASPCLEPGLKSGAMLLRDTAPHYMFVYDLRKNCPTNPGSVCRHTTVATSPDALRWSLTNQTLLPRRPGMWDAGLIEPGPPPLQLANGNYLFFYNGATLPNDRQYHVGWAVLAAADPSKVLQRSAAPLLSWTDRSWMVGMIAAHCATRRLWFFAMARGRWVATDTSSTSAALMRWLAVQWWAWTNGGRIDPWMITNLVLYMIYQ